MYKTNSELWELQKQYDADKLAPSIKEGLIINPKLGYVIDEKDIVKSIPFEWINKNRELYGELTKLSLTNPVANLNWDYIYFTNSSFFRPAAIAFEKSERSVRNTKLKPSYTAHIKGTKAYREFWKEEFNRIKNGYEPIIDGKPCGIRISGEFYFYLNYTKIKKLVETSDGRIIDVEGFPDFLSQDYYYYRELDARENPSKFGLGPDFKMSMVVTKSRRKGFSYKAAAGCVWIAAFSNNGRVAVASEPNSKGATDAVRCVRKCLPILDHLSDFTPFGRTDPGDPASNGGWRHEQMSNNDQYCSIKLGLVNTKTKAKYGRQSEIFTISLSKDDSASGEGLNRLYFEEAGKISNLDKAWIFSRETMKAGSLFRGIAIIFGTGGEMQTSTGKSGSTKPFSNMFYGPVGAEVAAYDNIYEYSEKPGQKCGFFVCDMWSNFGSYVNIGGETIKGLDSNGNAVFWVAELYLNKERREKKPPATKQQDYNTFLTQRCKTPSEAFLVNKGSVFNTADLTARWSELKTERGGFAKYRIPGELVELNGDVVFKPDLEGKLRPITSMDYDWSDMEGAFVRYEEPIRIDGRIPDDAYLISCDPIAMDESGGTSFNCVLVMRTPKYSVSMGPERVVAVYFGKKKVQPLAYLHQLLLKSSIYYNAKITYENDRDGGILQYFTVKNSLHRLLPFPSLVTSKAIPNSKTTLRTFGHSMATDRHKDFGERYLNEWLDYRHSTLNSVDQDDNLVSVPGKRNLDLLLDELLIEQLIHYNRNGNFDMVMALMGAIIQFEERFSTLNEEVHEDIAGVSRELVNYYRKKYGSHKSDYKEKANSDWWENPRESEIYIDYY